MISCYFIAVRRNLLLFPRIAVVVAWSLCGLACSAFAQQADSTPESSIASLGVVAEGLSNPGSLVVRPGKSRSGPDLLLAERGLGRVLGLATSKGPSELVPVIEGFDSRIGPTPSSMVFRSRNRLLVALDGDNDRPALVCEYNIDDDLLPMNSDDRKVLMEYPVESQVALLAIDRDHDGLALATGTHQWLLRGKLHSGPSTKLKQFVNARDASQVGTPTALAFSSKGYLVVAEAGSGDTAEGSHLVFYHPVNQIAAPLLNLPTGLEYITALAYSPATGNLYATNLAIDEPERSGLYRLQAQFDPATKRQHCRAVRAAEVPHPTSLTFPTKLYSTLLPQATHPMVQRPLVSSLEAPPVCRPCLSAPNRNLARPMSTRREKIEAMLEDEPQDQFLRYSLAMELDKEGDHDRSLDLLTELIEDDPPHVASYFMAGQQLARIDRVEKARDVLRVGIEVARQQGDTHAAGEMSEFLSSLGALGE